MKVSDSPHGATETYTVKFWYRNSQGFVDQAKKDFYSTSRAAHDKVEKFAIKMLTKFYKDVKIISITYN